MIGRAHCKQGRSDEAVAALEAMIATDPGDASLKASYGWFTFREDCRPEAALAAVLAGIAQAPEDADLRYVEAELQRMLDAPELALAAIREAARIEPQSAFYKRQVRRFEALVEPETETDPPEPDQAEVAGSTSSSG
jgi:tetratricopeptide (TPR) repeat protein